MDQDIIRKFILDYLSEKPDAADSLRGIAEMWIKRQVVEAELDNVEDVLKSLVAEGILGIRCRDGETEVYALAKKYKNELRNISISS